MKKLKKEKPEKLSKRSVRNTIKNLYEAKEEGYKKPTCREDCKDIVRPCPYIQCRYNLFLDIEDDGSIRFNQRVKDPTAVKKVTISGKEVYPSCALDMVEEFPSGISNDDIGKLLGGISRETVRLLSKKTLALLRSKLEIIGYNARQLAVSDNTEILEALDHYLEESK